MFSPSEVLGDDGPFREHIDGFAPRIQQQQMADAVARAIASQGRLICEAGTGVGKTFAYLVPALMSGRKTIVSTGTKNLQDQLFSKDVPLVRNALGSGARTALLKGRSNYLCPQRLELAEEQLESISLRPSLNMIRNWSKRTRRGDVAEITDLPEDSPLWPLVTSTADNCLGTECPKIEDCYVLQARREAQAADLVVINHHLLFADMALKADGFGELLPECDALILDEAHQLAEIAPQFFGQTLSSRQMLDLARDSIAEHYKEAGDMPGILEAADELEKAVRDLRLAFGTGTTRAPWRQIARRQEVVAAMDILGDAIDELHAQLEPAASRGKGLESCFRRAETIKARFKLMKVGAQPDGADGYIHWYETYTRAFSISLTPLDVAPIFAGHVEARPCAWVFTSATLAVGEGFAHFSRQLGLDDAETLHLDSPFDYESNALIYLPPGLPEPNDFRYTEKVIDVVLPLLYANRGRAFLLFTSHRALQQAAELLMRKSEFNLLVQGEAPRDELVRRFRDGGHSVLLGAASFWEGVDVRGDALTLVVIDKLPFASPGDPVLQARIEAMRRNGGNPFMDHQLPNAVIALKQGAGRLIRDVDDHGVLVLCDPRLSGKPYGRVFLDSLPAMPRVREASIALGFLADLSVS
ncbi:MAG: ATP-dependent DNA helicase [Gammaproteobacteria bacterium]|nr:ATP-dependent DNA helicase [Gammaproteobacteria bacterium]MCP5135631.1 ATP-dependent DNA helicase [Gammaproteobacteria bacterium]